MSFFKRKSIRLKEYDYSTEGLYFITLVCQDRLNLFGKISDGIMNLNPYGKIAAKKWLETPLLRPNISLGAYVIMPNHMHGIISIDQSVRANCIRPYKDKPYATGNNNPEVGECNSPQPRLISPSQTIGAIIRGYKGAVTKEINFLKQIAEQDHPIKVWQRNYYEHIIRTTEAHENIHRYILNNPFNWKENTLR